MINAYKSHLITRKILLDTKRQISLDKKIVNDLNNQFIKRSIFQTEIEQKT